MKRIGNLYGKIFSLDNIQLADVKASKRKSYQRGVQEHRKNQENNLLALRDMLVKHTYRTSEYTTFKIYEPKEREIFRLPFFPDRIGHHAIMNVLEPIFMGVFTADTYSCIKKRGIHGAARAVRRALRDEAGTKYCLKLDIKKFYPSINHAILKELLRRKFKDKNLLGLLDEIIDSADGLPIGNYLSQYLANFYLSYFDHWLKEEKRMRYYFRYADDIVILAGSKPELHALLSDISFYLYDRLKLRVKENYQVFPVAARGIDFVGYVFYHTHTRLRKSIKQNFARKVCRGAKPLTLAAYWGWAKHCQSSHLLKKLLNNEPVRRHGNKAHNEKLFRRQNKDQPHSQQNDSCGGSQNRRLEIQRAGQRQTADSSNQTGWHKAYNIHQLTDADGPNRAGAEGKDSL